MDQHKPSDIFTDGSGGQFCGLDEGSIGIHLQSYKIKQLPGENLAATQPRLRPLHLLLLLFPQKKKKKPAAPQRRRRPARLSSRADLPLLLSAAATPPASARAVLPLPRRVPASFLPRLSPILSSHRCRCCLTPPPSSPHLKCPRRSLLELASLPPLLDAAAIFASPQVPRRSVLRPCSLCCRPQPDRVFFDWIVVCAAALPQVKLGFDCYFSGSLPFRYKFVGERRMKMERRGKGEELLLCVGSWLCLAGFFSWSSHCCRFNDGARRIIATPSIQKLTHDNGHDWHL